MPVSSKEPLHTKLAQSFTKLARSEPGTRSWAEPLGTVEQNGNGVQSRTSAQSRCPLKHMAAGESPSEGTRVGGCRLLLGVEREGGLCNLQDFPSGYSKSALSTS